MALFGQPDIKKLKAKGNIEGLVKAIGYKDKYVRGVAAGALGEIGDARAVEPLIASLGDGEWVVRMSAAEALGKIGDARAVEPLIKALGDESSWDVRTAAALALGNIGDARAVEPLIAALGYKDKYVRAAAAEALGGIGDARAVDPLITAFGDMQYDVRKAAAEALGEIGTPAVEPLIAVLVDKDWFVRRLAAEALEKLGWQPDRGEDGARYWIAKPEWDKCVSIGSPAVEPLIAVLVDKDWNERRLAAEALEKLGWQPDRGEDGARYWIIKKEWDECVSIGAPAVEPLIAVIGDEEWIVPKPAVVALGKIGDARAVEPLIKALGDMDSGVRAAAAEALGKIGAPAVEPLIAALGDESSSVQAAAAEALGGIGTPAVEPLIAVIGDESNWRLQRDAVVALGKIGDARAVEPLIAALGYAGWFWNQRKAAAEALLRIYREGNLGQEKKQLILQCKPQITNYGITFDI